VKPAFLGLSLAAALGAYILAPAPNAQQVLSAQTKSQAFVIASVGVFDGERTRPDMNVVVEDGRIRAVDSTRDKSRRLPAIDGRGATLIPGFIDAHTHPRAVSDLQDALRFGVTAVLDMGLTSALTDQGVLRAAAASRVDVATTVLPVFLRRRPVATVRSSASRSRPSPEAQTQRHLSKHGRPVALTT
jgi:imidazolonepropionase-like amidohydrolase